MTALGVSFCHKSIATAGLAVSLALVSQGSLGGEQEERMGIYEGVAAEFSQKAFAKLDSRQSRYLKQKELTSAGASKLMLLHHAFKEMFSKCEKDDASLWKTFENSLKSWIQTNPRSSLAHLAYARFYISRGMSIRGCDYANSVGKDDWRPFLEYMEKAREYLESNKTLASQDPAWYELMGLIGQRQSWIEARYVAMLNEGLNRYPFYHQLYYTGLDFYSPRWGGNAKAMEKFIREALARTKSTEGFAIYTRLYSYASQVEFGDTMFAGVSEVDWPTMKKGIDEILHRYPDQWNVNIYAKQACYAGDKEKAAELLARIQGQAIPQLWDGDAGFYSFFAKCKSWALSP